MSYFVFLLCILTKFCALTLAAEGHTLDEVYELVSRIDESLRNGDRVRELTQILHIDRTLKKLENNLEEIEKKLDLGDSLDRHLPSDVRTNLVSIGNRMGNMETAVDSLQDIMKKMNDDMQILSEVEQRTENLKKDLNHKLTKMMNILSSLYQINKDLRNDLGNTKKVEESVTDVDLGMHGTTYLLDSLESLERKIKEQLSVISVQMKSEMDSLKTVTSAILYQCEKEEENDDSSQSDHFKTNQDSNVITKAALETIQNNLNRSQREIKEEFQAGMQLIEHKISYLTNVTSKSSCVNENIKEKQPETRESKLLIKETKTESCVSIPTPSARSCADFRASGNTCDGKYVILFNLTKAIMVYCDMTTDGGGWTVLMRRGQYGDKEITFNQNWKSYKVGFGDLDGEFWLGNENIHLITTDRKNDLRIEMKSYKSNSKNLTFGLFSIDNEIRDFRLRIGRPLESPLRIVSQFNGRPFVTWDRIMDQPSDNCANYYKGAWWYRRNCIYPDLTSERLDTSSEKNQLIGMQSIFWRDGGLLKSAEMKIRPADFVLPN